MRQLTDTQISVAAGALENEILSREDSMAAKEQDQPTRAARLSRVSCMRRWRESRQRAAPPAGLAVG